VLRGGRLKRAIMNPATTNPIVPPEQGSDLKPAAAALAPMTAANMANGGGGEIFDTLAEVRNFLKISRTKLWRMRRHGLRSVDLDGSVRIRRSDLLKYLADHTQ
jgi:hypothetical protein